MNIRFAAKSRPKFHLAFSSQFDPKQTLDETCDGDFNYGLSQSVSRHIKEVYFLAPRVSSAPVLAWARQQIH